MTTTTWINVNGVMKPKHDANGAPIHPTEEGIRNFWLWFGDSKTVDELGRPLVTYHGTNAHAYVEGQIDAFNTQPPSGRAAAYFSSEQQLAQQYGEKLYATYLRLQRPLIIHADGQNWAAITSDATIDGPATDEIKLQSQKRCNDLNQFYAELTEILGDSAGESTPAVQADRQTLRGLQLKNIPGLDDPHLETDAIVKTARKLGFDGVIFRGIQDSPTLDAGYKKSLSNIYAAFSPLQIKSATNNSGAFDPQSPYLADFIADDEDQPEQLDSAQRSRG